MTNVHTSRHIDLLPGRSFGVVLVNSLTLMRAGLSKEQAMAQALNVAGYRPRGSDNGNYAFSQTQHHLRDCPYAG